MTDLKPCPFCGGKVQYNYDLQLEPIGVVCHRCKMVTRFMRTVKPGLHTQMGEMQQAIARQWNRRSRI